MEWGKPKAGKGPRELESPSHRGPEESWTCPCPRAHLGAFVSAKAAGNAVRSKRGAGCLINVHHLYHEVIGLTREQGDCSQ